MEDVTPAVFDVFVDWIYASVYEPNITETLHKIKRVDDMDLLAIRLYVFADCYLISALKEETNRFIVEEDFSKHPIKPDVIIYAFANLPSNDPILDYYVEKNCHAWEAPYRGSEEEASLETLPHEYLIRYMKRSAELRVTHVSKPVCAFHGHETAEKWNDCGWRWPGDPEYYEYYSRQYLSQAGALGV